MAEFTAKDVQQLRQDSGAGMMDAKRALTDNNGDFEAAKKWLREKGLAKATDRGGRSNSQGTVAVAHEGDAAAIVELRCETDFVAKADQFTSLVQELATVVAMGGEDAAKTKKDAVDDLRVVLKENIELGRVVRVEGSDGHVVESYVHRQDGRGVNGVVVELDGGDAALAHDIAVHIAFTRPGFVTRDEVPQADIDEERSTLEKISRAEGKPEAAMEKILDGRLNGWFKERVLLDQAFVKDEKRTIGQLLGDATVVRFAQVAIGG